MFIHDAINNFETNYVDFINSKLDVKLMAGFLESNLLIQLTKNDNDLPRVATDANNTNNLKISEYEALPYIVKILRDVKKNNGDVIQYAIWNPIKKIGFINSFNYNVDTHNFNFQNKNEDIDESTWNLIKDLPDGTILINDLRY